MQNHLWCPSDPRGPGIDDVNDDVYRQNTYLPSKTHSTPLIVPRINASDGCGEKKKYSPINTLILMQFGAVSIQFGCLFRIQPRFSVIFVMFSF